MALSSLLAAHPFKARTNIIHAISIAVPPIIAVATNVAWTSFSIIAWTVSLFFVRTPDQQAVLNVKVLMDMRDEEKGLTLATSITPPEIIAKEQTNSEGGCDGYAVGGEMCRSRYVMKRDADAALRKAPTWLCIAAASRLLWSWEERIRARINISSAGRGLQGNRRVGAGL